MFCPAAKNPPGFFADGDARDCSAAGLPAIFHGPISLPSVSRLMMFVRHDCELRYAVQPPMSSEEYPAVRSRLIALMPRFLASSVAEVMSNPAAWQ